MRSRWMVAATAVCMLVCIGPAFFGHAQSAEVALGKDWRTLRDSLDRVYDELQQANKLRPSPLCDDETFLRRAYLDLLGMPPSPEEVAAFNPGKPDSQRRRGLAKREALIEQLLERPECAANFAEYWRIQCIGRDKGGELNALLERFFREAFAANKPWNQVVHELVNVTGRSPENPAVAYFAAYQNMRADLTGATSRIFMGKQIQCAECHDHPHEHWKMDDFEAFQGFFSLTASGQRGDGPNRYWYVEDRPIPGNVHELSTRLRLSGKYYLPKYLGGELYRYDRENPKPLRLALADWMTHADNQWFREMTVNRYFAYFLGMGFVMPMDDFNSINEPSAPVVIEMMGRDFAASGFDLRYLIKAICTSKLYQRTALPTRHNRHDRMYYSRFFVRKLSPEQLFRSVVHVTGIERLNTAEIRDVPDGQLTPDERRLKAQRDRMLNWRNNLARAFRDAYGSDEPEKPFDDYSGSILQALILTNFPLLGDGTLKTSLSEILSATKDGRERVRRIYLTVLGREPKAREWSILGGHMGKWADDDKAFEDLFLALLNTTEFAAVS